jgi:homocysteine S-methyltransferase
VERSDRLGRAGDQRPDPLRPFLGAGGVGVLDGGLATQLERLGADLRDQLWSARLLLDDPALIAAAHRAFFDAGADVAITASYQASVEAFAGRGVGEARAASLIAGSVTLARDARDVWWDGGRPGRVRPLVAASVGPYGAVLADGSEYTGRYPIGPEELEAFHARRLEILVGAEPDLLAVETVPSVVEAEAVLRALAGFPEVHAWISFTCRDGSTLADGTPFADAVAAVADDPHVAAVGANCTPPSAIERLTRTAATSGRPVVIYPNHGGTWRAATKTWEANGPQDLASLVPSWVDAGARLIGGCCGIDADRLRPIAQALGRR